jgi:hypothetical protein
MPLPAHMIQMGGKRFAFQQRIGQQLLSAIDAVAIAQDAGLESSDAITLQGFQRNGAIRILELSANVSSAEAAPNQVRANSFWQTIEDLGTGFDYWADGEAYAAPGVVVGGGLIVTGLREEEIWLLGTDAINGTLPTGFTVRAGGAFTNLDAVLPHNIIFQQSVTYEVWVAIT